MKSCEDLPLSGQSDADKTLVGSDDNRGRLARNDPDVEQQNPYPVGLSSAWPVTVSSHSMMRWHHPLLLRPILSSGSPQVAPSLITHSSLRPSSQHLFPIHSKFSSPPDFNIVHHYSSTASPYQLSPTILRRTSSPNRHFHGTATRYQGLLKTLEVAWKRLSNMPSASGMYSKETSVHRDRSAPNVVPYNLCDNPSCGPFVPSNNSLVPGHEYLFADPRISHSAKSYTDHALLATSLIHSFLLYTKHNSWNPL